jgi:hypothetical protein
MSSFDLPFIKRDEEVGLDIIALRDFVASRILVT